MSGNADAKTLDRLENCFEWNRDRKLIWKIRKEVEDFERWTEKKVAEMLRAKKTTAGSGEITYKKEKGPKYTVLPDF